jgi:putative tryptophan/tyrosine transport system substrate-binding protein
VQAEAIDAAQGRSPIIVDEIFRGTKLSEIPVERLSKFELVINLNTAKAIGLRAPDR